MNIENDFLTDIDLFGKEPELYYKGRSKKSSTLGIVLTIVYIILYIAFLIYKLIRMVRRIDVTFYDSYTFNGLPSIKLTNNEFYGGFGMGGIVDEKMYYLMATYTSKYKQNGKWVEGAVPLQTEICQLEWFGKDYKEVFKDQPMHNYYCIRDVSGMVLEGYSNLERFSYFTVYFFPCHGTTRDGKYECYNRTVQEEFFTKNIVELKIQDNDLDPTNYKKPVIRRAKDMNSPVFKDMYQLIYSYLQIVNIETDEDITGLNFFTDSIRKEQYIKYDHSFLIATPMAQVSVANGGVGDILSTGKPVAECNLQLDAKVLTEKRQYVQLIDVLGDVGGLMEIIYSFLNIISSFITEVLYDRSLVNSLFSFDLDKKVVVFNKIKKVKNPEDSTTNGLKNIDINNNEINSNVNGNNLNQNYDNLEGNNNIDIYSKDNFDAKNTIEKNDITITKKRTKKKKKSTRSHRNSQSTIAPQKINVQSEKMLNVDNRLSFEENKNIISIENRANEQNENIIDTVTPEKNLKNVYINNWLICCFWFTSRKKNINKVLFEEGSRIITTKLDILNMFNYFYNIEIMQKKMGIDPKETNMSYVCKYDLRIIKANNNFKAIDN